MGFEPDRVRAMSFYDYQAAFAGYRKANGIDTDGEAQLTASEEASIAAAIDRPLLWN